MSIATELSRIQSDRNTIRAKLVSLGMATNTDNLDKLAAAIEGIINQGAISVTVQEGDTYTIPAGYHNGSGTVSGIAGGGNYTLQSKNVTPTKKQQSITPDNGYYGLSDVTIAPIPDAYQDVTSVTAVAGEVLTGKIIVAADGTVVTGTMANNGAVAKTLDVTTISYTIPKGYHSGSGKVQLVLETKTVTPTKSVQDITPTSGKVLSKVTVAAIPDQYVDVTGTDVTSDDVLDGKVFANTSGKSTGTMPNNGTVTKVLDATNGNQTIAIQKGYHSGSGQVSIALETKTATPTTGEQNITPSNGKVLSKVTVEAIPDKFKDTTGTDVTAADVLADKVFVNSTGKGTGSMPNNGDTSGNIDGLTSITYSIPGGYTTGGKVTLTNDIEEALAAI
jgi:hypothetical protein